MANLKIISGGQTGADIGALKAAKECGFATGGMAPYRYWTEKGSNFDLRDIYSLTENDITDDLTKSIKDRTFKNSTRP
jgi:hypothetical protein